MADIEYSAELDDSSVLKSLNRIEAAIKDTADTGARSFDRIQKSSNVSGIQIGVVAGVVGELTERLIDLGVRAIEAFGQIAAGGVKLNEEAENIKISLTNIFSGNEAAADAFLEVVDEAAVKLGISRQELRALGKSILPDVGDIGGTIELLEQAVILGREAGVNIESVRIALEEALASGGDRAGLQSLVRRLNVPPDTIDRIQELGEEMGLAEAITQALAERVEKAGASADSFAETFTIALSNAKAEATDLQQLFGEPIFEQLKDELNETFAVFKANQDDIENVVEAFGDLAARVTEIIGSGLRNLLDNLDYEALEDVADNFAEVVNTAQTLADILFDEDLFNNLIDGANALLDALEKALFTAAQIGALVKANAAREQARQDLIEGAVGGPGQGRRGAFGQLRAGQTTAETEAAAEAAGQEAFNQSIRESVVELQKLSEENERVRDRSKERREETEKSTQADLDAANAELQRKLALQALADAQAAEAEIAAERAELEEELQKKLTGIARKQQRRREDDAINNANKLEDIARKQNQRIEDAALDLTRAEQDLARKQADERIDIQRDLSRERRDIEAETAEEIRRIRERASFDATEAERSNDAQRFLEIKRQEAQQIKEAQSNRDQDLNDAEEKARGETADLKEKQKEQLEAIQTKNRRALEDLQIRLERELEAQRIAEERQAAERQRQEARELADFQRLEQEKRQALEESLAAQFELIRKAEEAQAKLRIDTALETEKRLAEIRSQSVTAGGGDPTNPYGTPFSDAPNNRNQNMINQPTNPVYLPTITKSTTNSPTFNLSESIFNDPVARAQLKGFVLETMGEINA